MVQTTAVPGLGGCGSGLFLAIEGSRAKLWVRSRRVGTFPLDLPADTPPVVLDEGMDSSPSILGLPISSDYLEKKLAFGQGGILSICVFSKTVEFLSTSVLAPAPPPTLRSEGNLLLPSVSKPLLGRMTAVNTGQRQRTQGGQADSQSFRGGRGTWAGSKGSLKLRLTEGVFLMSLKSFWRS